MIRPVSPVRSLHSYPAERLADGYRHARGDAAIDTELPLATFPEVYPWPVEQVLAEDFWPEMAGDGAKC